MLLWDYHRAVRHNALDPSKRGEEIMKKLILLTLSIVSFNNYAVDFVYRVDSTPPDVIFRDGFSLLGYNRNFQQFISGRSCSGGSSDSRYIATTSSVNQTYAIARAYYSRSTFKGNLYRY